MSVIDLVCTLARKTRFVRGALRCQRPVCWWRMLRPKVERLRAECDRRGVAYDIEVDGGVNLTTAPRCVRAGASVLVAGSSVYNDRASVAANIADLRRAIERARAG